MRNNAVLKQHDGSRNSEKFLDSDRFKKYNVQDFESRMNKN